MIGVDMLAGGAPFCWDPFEAYRQGLVTNPNVAVFGEPGMRKSTLVKTFLRRMFSLYGDRRWVGVADPKGEYASLAEHLGLTTVKLSPGGTATINPLAPGPAAEHEAEDRQVLRRAEMCTALVATVLERTLTQVEDAVVFLEFRALADAADAPSVNSQPDSEPLFITERLPEISPGVYQIELPVLAEGTYLVSVRDRTYRQEEAVANLVLTFSSEALGGQPFVLPPTATGPASLGTWLLWLLGIPLAAGVLVTVLVLRGGGRTAEEELEDPA